jgi:hypothetical protein
MSDRRIGVGPPGLSRAEPGSRSVGSHRSSPTSLLEVVANRFLVESVPKCFRQLRQLVPRASLKQATRLLFVEATPLLEEERYLGPLALGFDFQDPFELRRTRPRTGFASNNCPVDLAKV